MNKRVGSKQKDNETYIFHVTLSSFSQKNHHMHMQHYFSGYYLTVPSEKNGKSKNWVPRVQGDIKIN